MTIIFSPSSIKLTLSSTNNSSKTPVTLNSIFLDKSPFAYPKILSFERILSEVLIGLLIPVHPKNWFIDLDV